MAGWVNPAISSNLPGDDDHKSQRQQERYYLTHIPLQNSTINSLHHESSRARHHLGHLCASPSVSPSFCILATGRYNLERENHTEGSGRDIGGLRPSHYAKSLTQFKAKALQRHFSPSRRLTPQRSHRINKIPPPQTRPSRYSHTPLIRHTAPFWYQSSRNKYNSQWPNPGSLSGGENTYGPKHSLTFG